MSNRKKKVVAELPAKLVEPSLKDDGSRKVVMESDDSFTFTFIDSKTFRKWTELLNACVDEVCLQLKPTGITCVFRSSQSDSNDSMVMFVESKIEACELLNYRIVPEKEHVIILQTGALLTVMKETKTQSIVTIEKKPNDPNIWFYIEGRSFPLSSAVRSSIQLIEPPQLAIDDQFPLAVYAVEGFSDICGTIGRSQSMYTRMELQPKGCSLSIAVAVVPLYVVFGSYDKNLPPVSTIQLPSSLLSTYYNIINKLSNPLGIVKFYHDGKLPFLKFVCGIGSYGKIGIYLQYTKA